MEAKENVAIKPEELMKARYKVIADYPNSRYSVGDILTATDRLDYWKVRDEYVWEYNIGSFAAIFKKLEWWEERAKHELPKYLKGANGGKLVGKAVLYNMNALEVYLDYTCTTPYPFSSLEPATKEEYDQRLTIKP